MAEQESPTSSFLTSGGRPGRVSGGSASRLELFSENPAASSPGGGRATDSVYTQQAGWGAPKAAAPAVSGWSADVQQGGAALAHQRSVDYTLKFVIVGDSAVGKSSLLNRFANRDRPFSENYNTTVSVDFHSQQVSVDGRTVAFQLWDTAGQERFRALGTTYYRGAQGILIVYDVTNEKSFKNLDRDPDSAWDGWLEHVDKHAGPSCKRVLLGNKCDVASGRKVQFDAAKAWADRAGVPFFETSAKEGHMVDETFISLARQIISDGGGQARREGLTSIAGPGSQSPQEASSCC